MTRSSTEPDRNGPDGDDGRSTLFLILGVALLAAAALFLLFGSDLFTPVDEPDVVLQQVDPQEPEAVVEQSGEGPAVGETAPDFALQDLEGNTVRLSDYRGQAVIINFWASWCGPCRIEMPAFEETYRARQEEGLVILAINREEDAQTVRQFFYDELDLSFTPLLDEDAAVANQYEVFGLPTTFVVNGGGILTAVHRGPLTADEVGEFVDQAMAG